MVRFARLLTTLSLVLGCAMSVGAETKTPSTTDVTVYDKRTYLEKRALVAGQLCATIPVTVPGSFLTGPIVRCFFVLSTRYRTNKLSTIQTLLTSQCLCIQGG